MNEYIKCEIKKNIDPKYRAFHQKLIPNVSNFLGVRVPILRKIAKEVSKKDITSYLENPSLTSYEEVMIYGLVLGYTNNISYLKNYLNYIDNWAICDTVCSNFKLFKDKKYLPFILSCIKEKEEYKIRFGIVLLLDYYLDDVGKTLSYIDGLYNDYYYVNMALAWLISIAYKKDKKKTKQFLKTCNLSSFVKRKAILKISELSSINTKEIEKLKKDML